MKAVEEAEEAAHIYPAPEVLTEAEAEGMMEKYTIQSLRWSMLAD